MSAESLWVGALSATGSTVVARLAINSSNVRLVVTSSNGLITSTSNSVSAITNIAKMSINGLPSDTLFSYGVECSNRGVKGLTGSFRTAPTGSASFTVAFAGDASETSNHAIFDTIRSSQPLMFIHLGDIHYRNVDLTASMHYRAAYDEFLSMPRQARLYREIPTAYVWDDHDYAGNNSNATAIGHDASCQMYRLRVPHYSLADSSPTGHIGQSWDIGRVRFIITDQRSAASADNATDNSSKTMLGTSQKTWFKNLLSNSSGKLIVWICPRAFGGVTTAGADHWGGFTTERTELGTHIHSNCPGRVIVLSADAHALAIDNGTNHTYGSEPLRTFQAAPLDRTPDSVIYGAAQYSAGWFNTNGQFGTMQIIDSGSSSLDVLWKGFNSSGSLIVTSSFTVAL